VADVVTGSGAIAVTLSHTCPNSTVIAIDICENALEQARKNANKNNAQCYFVCSSWLEAIVDNSLDCVVSNPPYIARSEEVSQGVKYEPELALYADSMGLSAFEQLIKDSSRALKSGGHLLVEHGWQQAENVEKLFIENGFKNIRLLKDLSGRNRVTLGKYIV
jgi:release factor glutamine methyltransferase